VFTSAEGGSPGSQTFVITNLSPSAARFSTHGALDTVVDAALAVSRTPPNVKNRLLVTLGGMKAAVSSATLVPGYTGIYQVKITVPAGVSAGDGIPLVVSMLEKSSVPATLAVR
jgi:uncharacterized protein (TIGR03437 family)